MQKDPRIVEQKVYVAEANLPLARHPLDTDSAVRTFQAEWRVSYQESKPPVGHCRDLMPPVLQLRLSVLIVRFS